MPWYTVPNFFPDYEDLSSEDQYHLFEGYCIDEYRTKPSGRHYKKIHVYDRSALSSLFYYTGFHDWHKKWRLKRFLFWRFWVRRRHEDRS